MKTAKRTIEKLSVERIYNGFAGLLSIHARKPDPTADALRIAQYPRGDDFSIGREHCFQVDLADVRRQIGDIEIGRILLLLLQQTQFIVTAV